MDCVDKRWSFQEEISKLFNASLTGSFPDIEEEALVHTSQTGEPGDFICQNVLTIWPKIKKSPDLGKKYSEIQKPIDVGEAINKNLQTYGIDMIDKEHSVQDDGFVPISLSRKWLTKSIHMMLKDGIETWAPKLPVERVLVNFPKLDDQNRVAVFRREAIKVTLHNMLKYSMVGIEPELKMPDQSNLCRKDILDSSFEIEKRETHVVIMGKQTVPFILTMDDFDKSFMELDVLRNVTELKTVDWVVYVAPVWQQEYIEMCFTAAKQQKWIVTDRNVKWNPSRKYEYPVATYAGYRTCSTEHGELVTLLRKVRDHCNLVVEGRDAEHRKYSADDVFHCVLLYTCLKNHRLADCTFNFKEMVGKEGNTFVYLLRTRAHVKRVTKRFSKHVKELKNASDLTLETCEGWEESDERMLEFHLLNFTEVLEESCLYVLPHKMCEYLYELAKKFNRYAFMRNFGDVAKTTILLLCEATAVVMDKCFQLLGIDVGSLTALHQRWQHAIEKGEVVNEPEIKKLKMVEIQQMINVTLQELKLEKLFITPSFVSGARDPARNSRFELFSFRPLVTSPDDMLGEGMLFGTFSVSDKYGIRSDGWDYLFEPDLPYVHLFDFEWCHARDIHNGRVEPLGSPSSCRSVAFSTSIEIFVQLYASTVEKDACFQLPDMKATIDLSDFWRESLNGMCDSRIAYGNDGEIEFYYIAIKDAVDTSLEVKFNKGNHKLVYGHICAYYGGSFSSNYRGRRMDPFMAVLFASEFDEFENGTLSLKRSELAVPRDASLVIRAHLLDPETDEMVLADTYEFAHGCSQHNMVGLREATCSLELNVLWKN